MSRSNWIPDPKPKSGSARISVSRGTENSVWRMKMAAIELGNLLKHDHFGLNCEMIYQFFVMVAKND